eukprot:Transcript_12161.p1 GENE.Transcript_12161~~Transcript_12161.p1  ORF type:complete len:109 (-),score=6.18 Transcript_12161:145-471(-)
MASAAPGAASAVPRAPAGKPRSATLVLNGAAIPDLPPPPPPELPEPEAAGPKSERSGRDPQSGVADVTQLLSLSEESVMQNTMVRRPPHKAGRWSRWRSGGGGGAATR